MLIVLFLSFVFPFISFGKILDLNFQHDDFGVLYLIQHHQAFPYPFHTITFLIKPIFTIFDLNPSPYYGTALVLLGTSTFLVSLLAYQLTKKRIIQFLTVFIFAFSFVGSDAMYLMHEAIRINLYLIIAFLTIYLYILFLTQRKIFFFISSVALFFLATNIFPYRAAPLVFILLTFDIFMNNNFNFKYRVIRFSPFFATDIFVYLLTPVLFHLHNIRPISLSILERMFSFKTITDISFTFSNLSLPYVFDPLSLLGKIIQLPISTLFFLGFFIFLIIFLKKRYLNIMFLCVILSLLGFITAGVRLSTLDRYLFTIRPFLAIFEAFLIYTLWNLNKFKLIKTLTLIFLITAFSLQARQHFSYQKDIIDVYGTFSKQAINAFKKYVPTIKGYSFFILSGQDITYINKFVAVTAGGFLDPEVSLAVYYGTTYDRIKIATSEQCDYIKRVLNGWKNKPVQINNFYADFGGIKKTNLMIKDICKNE